ncbi:DUF4911 domain-containing protein [Desulfonauticus submarinus]|uniref:DUF4911 domain-containing protein n=1 Tax=Desulfonauticus submarinus TaxID=206665 RepID=A0A1H0DVR7_9BACT|nr:DUF4911 domain-containing protein [Desulfonauticus submarinus]SDN74168.1 protein of unknown function [Desulfonauticus submarinus]
MFSCRIYLKIPRSEIAYLKFLIEGWDNLAYFTVIDKYKAVVQLVCSKDYLQQVLFFLKKINSELNIDIIYVKEEI